MPSIRFSRRLLATGERFQGVLPPATTNGGAFAIRKQVIKEMSLDDYRKMGSFDRVEGVNGEESSRISIANFANFWTPEKSRILFAPR